MRKKLRRISTYMLASIMAISMVGCGKTDHNQTSQKNDGTEQTIEEVVTTLDRGSVQEDGTGTVKDYYADDTFDVPEGFDDVRSDVTLGTYVVDQTYYSSTIGQEKKYNVILPAGYSENEKYPVIYALHGFGGNRDEWSFANVTYSNMVADGKAKAAIFVLPDMWTDTRSFDECDGYAQRASYDRFVEDLNNDLMPHIAKTFSVKEGRENTAIIGLSQGGTEALGIGFQLQDKIGFIGSLSPATGVIPTPYYADTFWGVPILEDFVINSAETMPYYIMLEVGSLDPWDIDCTVMYGDVMTENEIPHHYYMLEGGEHNYYNWVNGLYNFGRRIF